MKQNDGFYNDETFSPWQNISNNHEMVYVNFEIILAFAQRLANQKQRKNADRFFNNICWDKTYESQKLFYQGHSFTDIP